jgi:hypothetical protein
MNYDHTPSQAKQLILAALDWVAAGEPPDQVPAVIASLADDGRARLLAQAHELGEALRRRGGGR